jgi:transcription-repair coupling factor (superfamily II helicase)
MRGKDTGADVVVVPASTALYRLAPREYFLAGPHLLQGQAEARSWTPKALGLQLTMAGYQRGDAGGEHRASTAVRGGLVDLFPMGRLVPYRMDLFDDEVDSIRTFDVDSQRSRVPGAGDTTAARRASSRWTTRRAPPSAAAWPRNLLEGDPSKSGHLQGRRPTAWPAPASSTTCRCSSSDTATRVRLPGADATRWWLHRLRSQ